MTAETSTDKPLTRPRGRPPGAKNKDTIFKELMQEDFQALASTEVRKVFAVLFEKAQDGDMQAIKMVLDRVVPATKAVDLDQVGKKGLTVNITVGSLEDIQAEEVIDGEFVEVEEES